MDVLEEWPDQDLGADLAELGATEGPAQVVELGATDMDLLCRSQVRCGRRRRVVWKIERTGLRFGEPAARAVLVAWWARCLRLRELRAAGSALYVLTLRVYGEQALVLTVY